jgi:hypothetical protein
MVTTDGTPPEQPPDPPSWFEAYEQVLEPLLNARSLIALLQGAEAVKLFRGDTQATTARKARSAALTRVARGGWGVPTRSAAELAEEVTVAGFTDAVAASTPGTGISVVAAIRP